MADDAPEEEKPKRSIVKIILLAVGGPILIGAGFAGGMFYAGSTSAPSEEVLKLIEQADPANAPEAEELAEDGTPKPNTKEVPEEEVFVTSYFEFPEPLTTNLANSNRFLQVAVSVSTQYDEKVIENIKTHTLALKSDILATMSSYSETDIVGKAGRDGLAAAIRDAMNSRLMELENFGRVEHVYFSSFVLQ